jgi:hypothetical protein
MTDHCAVRAQRGWRVLTFAAGSGQTATVTELVRLGADVNAKSDVRSCYERGPRRASA